MAEPIPLERSVLHSLDEPRPSHRLSHGIALWPPRGVLVPVLSTGAGGSVQRYAASYPLGGRVAPL